MALVIRSWNVYHGRSHPAGRRGYLAQAVQLVSRDGPDVVCLQELPLWSLDRLTAWSGMQAFSARTRPAALGTRAGGLVTALHHGLLRSAFCGQGNAVLVKPSRPADDLGAVRVSRRGSHPRVCHAVRIEDRLVVANVHLSGADTKDEADRALSWLAGLARPQEPVVLAGDFNARLALEGFTPPGPGIDDVLVKGAVASALRVWPLDRRRQNGVVLSDHAPVEKTVS
jgi:endonuclease/exonuclease/phosphatase family metal-dependent hydrolase